MAPALCTTTGEKPKRKLATRTKKFKPFSDVPLRAFQSPANMTPAERMSLADSLSAELYLVRALQARLEAAEAALKLRLRPKQPCAAPPRRPRSSRRPASRIDWPGRALDVIPQPIDLGTSVGRGLDSGENSTAEVAAADVQPTFSGALAGNSPSTAVHDMKLTPSKQFENGYVNETPRATGVDEVQISRPARGCGVHVAQ